MALAIQAPSLNARRVRASSTILRLSILPKVRRSPRPTSYRYTIIFDSDGAGELVAIHRKVHLFDIDIPGKIKFKVNNLFLRPP